MDADKFLIDWADVTGRARRPAQAPTDAGVRLARPALRVAGGALMVAAIVAGLAWVAPRQDDGPQLGGVAGQSPSPSPSAVDCPVTIPNQAHTIGWPASDLDHGVDGLYTVLWPDGIMRIPPEGVEPGGSLGMKLVFFRDPIAAGPFTLSGRRVDGVTLPMSADVPDGYGESGVQATGLHFPTEGCWEITASSGPATLSFVTQVLVERVEPRSLIGQPAPAFELSDADGEAVSLAAYLGRPVIVHFTAPWCVPCKEDLAMLAAARTEHGRLGLDVVSIAVKDDVDAVRRLAAEGTMTWPVALDPDGDVFAASGGLGLPMSVFIDRGGVVRSIVHGPLTDARLADEFDRLEHADARATEDQSPSAPPGH